MRRFWWLALLVACSAKHPPPPKPAPAAEAHVDPWAAGSGSSMNVPTWMSDPKVLRDIFTSVDAHVAVLKSTVDFSEHPKLLAQVERRPETVAAETFLFSELEIAGAGGPKVGSSVKGVDPERVDKVLTVGQHMVRGKLDLLREKTQTPAIILGDVLADHLGVRLGDVVTVSVPGESKQQSFRVGGMFHLGFEPFDDHMAFVALPSLQQLIGRDLVMGIEMRLADVDKSADVAKAIEKELGNPPYRVMDWYEMNKGTFRRAFGELRP